MLVHVTGVAGTGKSTLRKEFTRLGSLAADGDDGLCGWFDLSGKQVPNVPLENRTSDWYENHQWRLMPGAVERLGDQCADGVGYLLGVFADATEISEQFGARYFLTAPTEVILARLKARDGVGYDTRFAAFGGPDAWQEAAESYWAQEGYLPLDADRPVAAVATELLALANPA